jgi:hypothetical protein
MGNSQVAHFELTPMNDHSTPAPGCALRVDSKCGTLTFNMNTPPLRRLSLFGMRKIFSGNRVS